MEVATERLVYEKKKRIEHDTTGGKIEGAMTAKQTRRGPGCYNCQNYKDTSNKTVLKCQKPMQGTRETCIINLGERTQSTESINWKQPSVTQEQHVTFVMRENCLHVSRH